MNQTYLVDEKSIEIKKSLVNSIYLEKINKIKFKSNLILMDRNKYQQEQQLFKKKHEIKLKLTKMKKRTKLLLKNHNWRKYFAEEELVESVEKNSKLMTQSLNETMFNEASFTFNEDLNSFNQSQNEISLSSSSSSIYTESSFVSTYEIQKFSQQLNNDQQSKLNLFNYFNENKSSSMSSPAAAQLPQLSCSTFTNTSMPFSTSEMFQVMSTCSMGNGASKTSLVSSTVPNQKNTMKYVNKLLTTNTPVSIKRKQYNNVPGNICSSLFKVTKISQPLLSSSSYISNDETDTYKQTHRSDANVKFSPIVKLEKLIGPSHRHLRRQPQSLTFIADLASTSTPTRVSQQPIASTPKISSHDPLKYHPTHTIRNKAKKVVQQQQQPIKITRKKQPSNKLHCHLQISRIETVKSLDNNNIKRRGGSKRVSGVKKRKIFASELNLDCLKYTVKQNNIHLALNYKRDYNIRPKKIQEIAAAKTNEIVKNNHRVTKRKTASNHSFVSSFSSINSCENCNICNINGIVTHVMQERGANKVHRLVKKTSSKPKRRKLQHQPPSSSKTKFKATTFEISLEDLLYAPAKIRNLEPATSTNPIVRSTPVVNNGTATNANAASKVYYL